MSIIAKAQELGYASEEVRSTKGDKETKVLFPFGENLQEAVALYGEDAVFKASKAQMVVRVQSVVRTQMDANKSVEEIQTHLNGYTPGESNRGKSDVEKQLSKIGKLSSEEQAELIATLQASMTIEKDKE